MTFFKLNVLAILTSVLTYNVVGTAYAQNILPTGGNILHGDAMISVSNNQQNMAIISSSNNNVIAWDDFSVGVNNKVVFDNNNYLNIVKGSKESVIAGSVISGSTGSFYLVNPNGINVTNTGRIDARNIGLSTSKIDEDVVNTFVDTGDFTPKAKGMGKVSLVGSIKTENIIVDGGQVIIRDIENIKDYNGQSVTNRDKESIKIKSSIKRIDVGGNSSIDLINDYKLTEDMGTVSHLGQKAISTKEEMLNLKNNLTDDYFLTNDLDLGTINTTVTDGNAFRGTFDGCYNKVSYNLDIQGNNADNIGLFSTLDGAKVENLKVNNSTISVDRPKDNQSIGGLAGTIKDSKLKNVEIDKVDIVVRNGYNANNLKVGGTAGSIKGTNTLNNVTSSVSDRTVERFVSNDKVELGAVAATAQGTLNIEGVTFSKNTQDDVKAIADNRTSGLITNIFDKSQDIHNDFVLMDGEYQHKNFYTPYFVGSNYEYTYDKENPKSYNYFDYIDNPYFKTTDYVDLNLNYTGNIENIGTYDHAFNSKVDGTKFYFIQDGIAHGEVTQRVQVKDVELIPEIIPTTEGKVELIPEIIPTTEGKKDVNVATAPVLMLPMVASVDKTAVEVEDIDHSKPKVLTKNKKTTLNIIHYNYKFKDLLPDTLAKQLKLDVDMIYALSGMPYGPYKNS